MIINCEKSVAIEKIKIFNKLMIDSVKAEKDEFEFDGSKYMLCSDGVCVQTLILDRLLYRISIEDYNNNLAVSNKLANYLWN